MDLSLYNHRLYRVRPIGCDDQNLYDEYLDILKVTYSPLGFFRPAVLPKENSQCFGLLFDGRLEGIFAVTPIRDISKTPYMALVPNMGHSRKVAEISNVVLRKRVRGAVALGVILYEAAQFAVAGNYDALVGTTRHQTLPFFVDFGVTPVFHEPLHLMGDESIDDFVIYFETADKESIDYMHARARRFFQKEMVLAKIRGLCAANGRQRLPRDASPALESHHVQH
jgi:hypothetical protein